MKQLILTIIITLAFLCHSFTANSKTNLSEKEIIKSARSLISRITPGYEKQFVLEVLPMQEEGLDRFEVSSKGTKPLLRGTSPVALATAFNWYLKYTCHAEVSWSGDQLNLPEQLPLPIKSEKRNIQGKYRAYMNYCTLSYTAPWWDWERWQREIDFMAMNSINMPLQTIGLDAVWYETLEQMGLSDMEIRSFLVGPAHQAWQWMPNIQGFAEPLPKSWIKSHIKLAQQIFEREIELGMQPIQQAFTGYVPKILAEKYPDARISKQPEWYGFEGVSQLDPLDPLFEKIGLLFLENQKKLFGTYGMYGADPFHESKPPVSGSEYLNQVGKRIYKLINDFDPDGTVVMQAWSIREEIVTQMPKDKVIVFDLNGSRYKGTNNFWGYPFVVGNLHNFGGRINLHGDMPLIASNQFKSAQKKAENCIGSGLFMESIIQNRAFYSLAFEMPCHEGSIDPAKWMSEYATRIYGVKSEKAQQAWGILLNNVYKRGTNGVEFSSIVAARPALRAKKSGPNSGFSIPYSEKELYKVMELLLADSAQLKESAIYKFDLVDIQRQLMTNLAQTIHKRAADSYEQKDIKNVKIHTQHFLDLLLDLDELLASRTEYNFDQWVSDARRWGKNSYEKNLLEKDATTLITFWGFTPGYECKQFDYSWREWSGLIKRYYHSRWEMFYKMAFEKLEQGVPYVDNAKMDHGREAFRGNAFYDKLADWEIEFVNTPKQDIDTVATNNEIELADKFYNKYRELAKLYGVF